MQRAARHSMGRVVTAARFTGRHHSVAVSLLQLLLQHGRGPRLRHRSTGAAGLFVLYVSHCYRFSSIIHACVFHCLFRLVHVLILSKFLCVCVYLFSM